MSYRQKSLACRRRRVFHALGCSAFAMAMAGSPAWAECNPDSVAFGGTVTCDQVDEDGLVASTTVTVTVRPGAQVQTGADAAISATSGYLTLVNNGTIAGGARPGVLIGQAADISVGVSSTISGSAAILLRSSGSQVFANIQNNGQLIGTSGAALVAETGTFFNNVFNGSGTTLGGIAGHVNFLNNAGTIDGSTRSAIATIAFNQFGSDIGNDGTIRSSGSAATIDLGTRGLTDNTLFEASVGNRGLIENSGTGAAISSNGNIQVSNSAQGRIASAGSTAISTTGSLRLTNAGTIVGSVISTAGAGNGSTVDTVDGAIQGDLLLGAGDDFLNADFDFITGQISSVTGTVDGGGGTDTIVARIGSNATITAVSLPTNFERAGFDLANGVAVAIGAGASFPQGFVLGGNGKLTVTGDFTTTGPAITPGAYRFSDALIFENQAVITANLTTSGQRAIDLNVVGFDNSGRITANGGDGVRLASILANPLMNSGTIEASGTALELAGGMIANSGTIQSTGGIGLKLSNAGAGDNGTNTGTISGATVGVTMASGQFTNSGTISGGTTGITLSGSSILMNGVGSTISGGSRAIDAAAFNSFSATVRNAGTINGNVDLRNSVSAFVNEGGTVNGALIFGAGDDVYVTDLGTSGITGSIDGGAGYDLVRYRVHADTSTTPTPLTGFEAVNYELIGDVALNVSAMGQQSIGLSISGVGSADVTMNLVGADHTLLDLSKTFLGTVAPTVNVPNDLDVISHGDLSLSSPALFGFSQLAAVNVGTVRFENAGTITATSAAGGYYLPSAILNGDEIVNSGTISLGGAIGVQNALKLVNTGSIVQIAGAPPSQGVVGVRELDNSGLISVDGIAFLATSNSVSSGYNVTNSSTIESLTTTAVELGNYRLANRAGGTIRGNGRAIRGSSGSSVLNQGTIVGDVLLGESNASFGVSTFISDGGTLTGNLTFGGDNDVFLQRGASTGVSGTIDGGGGIDTFGRTFYASTATSIGDALAAGFERELIEASGVGTTVTLTGPAGGTARDIYLAGAGGFLNLADIAAAVHLTSLPRLGVNVIEGQLGAFDNEARINSVDGSVGGFRNGGTISSGANTSAVSLELQDNLDFANSGNIRSQAGLTAVDISGAGTALSIANSGTLTGGLNADMRFAAGPTAALRLDNSGTISRADEGNSTVRLFGGPNDNDGSVMLQNSGRISATGDAATAVEVSVYRNITPSTPHAGSISVTNTGTIEATGAGSLSSFTYFGQTYTSLSRVTALAVFGDASVTATIVNAAGGKIVAGGALSTAVTTSTIALDLENNGTISGNAGSYVSVPGGSPTYIAGTIQSFDTADRVVNNGTIMGSTDLGRSNDRVENYGTIVGDVLLGYGDDTFVQSAGATILSFVDAGEGMDTFTVDATGGGTVNASQFLNFEHFTQIGTGDVTYTGQFGLSTVYLAGGTITVATGETLGTSGANAITGGAGSEMVANSGTVTGGVSLGAGDDVLNNAGLIAGPVDLGADADTLIIREGAHFGSTVRGGSGNDTISLQTTGSEGKPTELSFDGFSEFEVLRNTSGVAAISGAASSPLIEIIGGRLIGRTGSTLTGNVAVASGATFGSAGTVIGNVTVASGGALSPGASPGTMTVQGNVSLAGGTNTLFELTPTVTDKLLVSGNLAIASGATLTIVGDRPLTPGQALDLIVADGGVTGSFTTVNKAQTVAGFLRQTETRLQILGTFVAPVGTAPQPAAAIDHVNSVLVSGTGSAALLNAVPLLLNSSGTANAAAFAALTPESYATAQQLGVEQGLSIAKAARTGALASHLDKPGVFAFAQGLGNWRQLRGDSTFGTNAARSHTWGALSGIGYGDQAGSIGVFVGHLDSGQRIRGLGASTNADGTIAGIAGHVAIERFDIGLVVAYDWTGASTTRALPGNTTAKSGRYDLHGLVLDIAVGYSAALTPDWSLRAGAGVTNIRTRRGAVREAGGVFALDIDRDQTSSTFLDGSLRMQGGQQPGAKFHPWIEVGARHQMSARALVASGGLANTGLRFAAASAARQETLAIVGAGVSVDIAPRLAIFGSYNGEFAKGATGNEGNIGLRFAF
jgi:hypothetical protein